MIIDLDKEPSLVREFLTSEKTMKELALNAGFDTPNKLKKEVNKLKNFEYFTVKTIDKNKEIALYLVPKQKIWSGYRDWETDRKSVV